MKSKSSIDLRNRPQVSMGYNQITSSNFSFKYFQIGYHIIPFHRLINITLRALRFWQALTHLLDSGQLSKRWFWFLNVAGGRRPCWRGHLSRACVSRQSCALPAQGGWGRSRLLGTLWLSCSRLSYQNDTIIAFLFEATNKNNGNALASSIS